MAVEKMNLVNITSRIENLTDLLKDVINIGQIEPIDAFGQVASRAFSVKASSENVELTEDMNNITSFKGPSKESLDKLNYLKDFLGIEEQKDDSRIIDRVIGRDELESLYNMLEPMIKKREELISRKDNLINYKNNLEILKKAGIDIEKIKKLNYFDYRYGEVTKDGRFILKNNYDNIPSLIIHLDEEAQKSAQALNDLIDLDKNTSKRRKEVNEIIENERNESLRVANNIDRTYLEKTSKEINKMNLANDEEIRVEAIDIKDKYSRKKDRISSLYKEKVDDLVDEAFDKIIDGDGYDR